ncbi:MAG: element excision factor XisH family protein [Saprospiraceae bacterium]
MARDFFHKAVRSALEKDGWTITNDPYLIKTELLNEALAADLGAEKLIGASKGKKKILVEIKSFLRESLVYEFHRAVGQIIGYQINMEIQEPDRMIFLAIPQFAWDKMVEQPFYRAVLEREKIHCLIFEPESESIISWKE